MTKLQTYTIIFLISCAMMAAAAYIPMHWLPAGVLFVAGIITSLLSAIKIGLETT